MESSTNPPMVGGRPMSPVHFSWRNGVHSDIGHGKDKEHVPFGGQTTLPTFRIGGRPNYENDKKLGRMGGMLKPN